MKQRNWLWAGLGVAALAIAVAAWLKHGDEPESTLPEAAAPAASPPLVAAMPAPALEAPPLHQVTLSEADLAFVAALRDRFGSRIRNQHSQIKLIEQLMAYLMAQYPDDWTLRLYAFLQRMFPELAGQLYAQFQKLAQYNDWLRDNREALMQMSPQERRAALLAARQNAFGADAAEIWAAEARTEQIRAALEASSAAEGVPLSDKFSAYVAAIDAAYGAEAGAFMQARQTELINTFLATEGVQRDLHAMPAGERNAALRELRGRMGMDEAALQRWDALDRERDTAWDNGLRYMAERDRIQAEHDGAEEAEQLSRLQEQSFGAEAETIRAEEESGFYRYGRQRRFGRE